jgi:hypothetical protein
VSVNDWSHGDTFHGEIAGDRISAVRELCDPSMCKFFPVLLIRTRPVPKLIAPGGYGCPDMSVGNKCTDGWPSLQSI